MRKGDRYTILFALAVCVACSLLLSVTSAALRKRQDEQVELDRRRNVLKALGVPLVNERGEKLSAAEVQRFFNTHIEGVVIDPATGDVVPGLRADDLTKEQVEKKERLPLYTWIENGEVVKYAFPVSGKGLWSTIYGYMALEKDLATIAGVTFYRHGETPGLGGEISTDWFQEQFKGKKVFESGRLLRFEVVKGRARDRYPNGNDRAVDGISGASLTGKGINQFLNADLERYEKYFAKIRKG